jgi:hypothetical protein
MEGVYGKFNEVKLLFADLISVCDATYHDVVDDLVLLHSRHPTSPPEASIERLRELYATLDRMVQAKEDCSILR